MSHSFDPMVYELAVHFLEDDAPEADAIALARHIQQQIEDWLEDSITGAKVIPFAPRANARTGATSSADESHNEKEGKD